MGGKRKVTYDQWDQDKAAKDDDSSSGQMRWWNSSPIAVAGRVQGLAAQLENGNWGNTFMSYVCARYMTNRSQPAGFGYSMSRRSGRVAQAMVAATWTPPTINVIGLAADVMINKIWKNRPWLQIMPTVKGSYRSRSQCKAMSQFVDAAFYQLSVWDKAEMCGVDCMQYPSAFIKVGPGIDNKLRVDRVLASEILLTPEQMGSWSDLRSCLQRVFIPKQDLIAQFAVGKDESKIRAAIRNAPGVYPGFYTSNNVDYDEVAALVEGWSLPLSDGTPGRHVLTVGDVALIDEPWTRERLPFAKLDFVRLSNEYMGQSLAEIQLPLQRYIDRLSAAIDEIEQRWSFPRFFIENSSHVDTDQFSADFVEYSGTKPEKDATNSVPPELYQSRDKAIEMAMTRVGISQQTAGGQKQPGLSSGLAIMASAQIDDARHVDLSQRYEDFLLDIGELIIEECADIKPTFIVDGNQAVNWKDVSMDRNEYKTHMFPMSRLPQQMSARYEMINGWYQNGTISRADKMRLENMPDNQVVVDSATSSADWVENALDKMVETGKYVPPLPYIDVKAAKIAAQARFVREDLLDLDESRLRVINRFLSALNEMGPQPGSQMLAPGQSAPQPAVAPQPGPGQQQGAPQSTGSGQVGPQQ